MSVMKVALEMGQKKVFAIAIDWPGWARAGRDEASAVQALLDYAPRYARAMQFEALAFQPPASAADFTVVERVTGSTTTDFGAPDAVLSGDHLPVDEQELARMQKILSACWKTLASVRQAAAGKQLRTGPRGGGRDLQKMIAHVVDAEAAYLSRLAWKRPRDTQDPFASVQQASLVALAASARGELPRQGPRGGVVWPARVYARRSAWHILDHAWEIEDRLLP